MVNILSKSVPKFSISGGVTTVLLPVFTQCVQVQSGSQGAAKRIRPNNPPPLPPTPQVQPHIRVLGPNFQLPGSSGSAHVRTVAVSTFATSGTHTISSMNAIVSRPMASVVTGSNSSTVVSSTSAMFTGSDTIISGLPSTSSVMVTGNNVTGMPVLCPMQPISVSSVDTAVPVFNPDAQVISLDTTCQLSPAMPSLAPIASHSLVADPVPSATETNIVPQRSLTPQPVKAVQELDLKPRSFTPNLPVSGQLDDSQIRIANLSENSDLTNSIVTFLPKVDSSSSLAVTDITTEDAISSTGNAEELITIADSTENSCSSHLTNTADTVDDGNEYIVSVTPASQFMLENRDPNSVTEDTYVTVTHSEIGTLEAESTEVVAMDNSEGVELLQMIDSSATDPMQYINQESKQP